MTPRLDEIQIELAGLCNATCSYCTWRERTVGRQLMATSLAVDVLEQAKAMDVPRVYYHGLGEPLLHPDLLGIIAHGARLGFAHQLVSTNCFNLKDELLDIGTFRELSVVLSLHWVLQPRFLERCIDNAIAYLEARPQNRRVYVQMVCHESVREHYDWFVKTFLPLVERLDNAVLWLKQPQTWPMEEIPQIGFAPSGSAHPKIEVDSASTPYSLALNCDMPMRFLMVMADGTCAPCCVGTTSWGLGKLPEANLSDVWESPRMAEIRRLWAAADDSLLCGRCKKRTDCRTAP